MSISNVSLIRSDVMPVLNISGDSNNSRRIYTITMDSVVDEIALEIKNARPAAIIGALGLTPEPIAKAAAIGQVGTAAAVVLEAGIFSLTNGFKCLVSSFTAEGS
jgi:hypothetical protein